jgi:hypothetical protein
MTNDDRQTFKKAQQPMVETMHGRIANSMISNEACMKFLEQCLLCP